MIGVEKPNELFVCAIIHNRVHSYCVRFRYDLIWGSDKTLSVVLWEKGVLVLYHRLSTELNAYSFDCALRRGKRQEIRKVFGHHSEYTDNDYILVFNVLPFQYLHWFIVKDLREKASIQQHRSNHLWTLRMSDWLSDRKKGIKIGDWVMETKRALHLYTSSQFRLMNEWMKTMDSMFFSLIERILQKVIEMSEKVIKSFSFSKHNLMVYYWFLWSVNNISLLPLFSCGFELCL